MPSPTFASSQLGKTYLCGLLMGCSLVPPSMASMFKAFCQTTSL